MPTKRLIIVVMSRQSKLIMLCHVAILTRTPEEQAKYHTQMTRSGKLQLRSNVNPNFSKYPLLVASPTCEYSVE